MNIIINATPLLAPLTGIGQYIRHLFTAMQEIPDAHVRSYYGLSCEDGIRLPSPQAARNVQRAYGLVKRLALRPRVLRKAAESLCFRYHAGRGGEAIYHEPNFVPLPYRGPLVLSVHDLSCFDHPETHPVERVRWIHEQLPPAILRADHIVVDSADTQRGVMARFGLSSEKVSVTYLAADQRYHPRSAETLKAPLDQLGLAPQGYVLSVGTLEPRKNLSTLFDAYAALPDALRARFPLAVAGMTGWHTEGLLRSAEMLMQRGELRFLGYVADELIPALYAGAAAFAYPSRYEGFGLPPLEAMASGVPVIASNRTSLPEVVGEAGILFDPDDTDALRRHLQQLLEDRAYAAQLAGQGVARAAGFSWQRCARETYAVYEKVLRERA